MGSGVTRRLCCYLRVFQGRHPLKADNILVRNFPAKIPRLAALDQTLLEEDRAAGIGYEGPRSGEQNIACAVLHLNPAAKERRVASHPVLQCRSRW